MSNQFRKRIGFAAAGGGLAVALFAPFGCAGGAAGGGQAPPPGPPAAIDPRLAQAHEGFAFRLLRELAREDAGENVFLSPASVSLALAMTYNGAEAETKEAMAQTLGIAGFELDALGEAYRALLEGLEEIDPKVQLTLANSLWAHERVTFEEEFMRRNRAYYGAEVTPIRFTAPDAAARINGWVEERTKDKIKDLIKQDDLTDETLLILINAVYFHGLWASPFKEEETKDGPFHLPGGEPKQVPLMRQKGHFPYLANDRFQAIALPYGEGRTRLYVFLPRPEVSLADLVSGLDAEQWREWLGAFRRDEGTIVLPRFKAEYEASLKDALTALGMGIAFDRYRANLHGIWRSGEQLWIEQVRHKALIEVDEKGTEAAAATGVVVGVTSVRIDPPFEMVVDRPFLVAIRDEETGTLLFLGAITQPE